MYKYILKWMHLNWFLISDFLIFITTVLMGTFIKIYKEPNYNNPNKWRASRLFSEFLVSLAIAGLVLALNAYILHFPKLLELALCVWAGAFNSVIFKEFDLLIAAAFKRLHLFIFNKTPIVFMLASLVLASCSTQKIIKHNKETATIHAEIAKKKLENIKSLAIHDTVKILVQQSNYNPLYDSIVNQKVKDILSQINTQKTSGNNSFGVYFDQLKKELVAYAHIGQTENKKITFSKIIYRTKTLTITKDKPVRYIPKWCFYSILGLMAGVLGLGVYIRLKN